MFELDDIELRDGTRLTVKKVTDGMYAFPDAYETLKEDFFKALDTPQPLAIVPLLTDRDLSTLKTKVVS